MRYLPSIRLIKLDRYVYSKEEKKYMKHFKCINVYVKIYICLRNAKFLVGYCLLLATLMLSRIQGNSLSIS